MDKKMKKRNRIQTDEGDNLRKKNKKNKSKEVEVHKSTNEPTDKKELTTESSLENNIEDSKLDKLVPQLEKKKKEFIKSKIIKSKGPNKKIIFDEDDDEPCEDSNSSESKNDLAKVKGKSLNEDEAEVKDEDIDKFCDEITEEDNQQYEDWVKLIEAKLHCNKKPK